MNRPFAIEALGEDALLLRFGDIIDPAINRRVHACAAALRDDRPAWMIDIIPAFATLAVCVDPNAFAESPDPLDEVRHWLLSRNFDACLGDAATRGRTHRIKVHYGGTSGPDLDAVAAHAGLTLHEVIRRHCAVEYRVGMLGFAPGFPYLIGMDPALAMPRHATPRTEVCAGSVGIAGAQTGIYPRSGPGGWQIIGQAKASLFVAGRDEPALLQPGDSVYFVDSCEHEDPST